MVYLEITLRFLATLLATLTGVFIAFGLDRIVDERNEEKRVLRHLKSLEEERRINERVADGTDRLIREFQNRGMSEEADHYIIDLFTLDAWESALDGPLVEHLDDDPHQDLQELYWNARNTNELIRRLRTEQLSSEIGKTEEIGGGYSHDIWTIAVDRWDYDSDEKDIFTLGSTIGERAREIETDCRDLEEELDAEIERLSSRIDSQGILDRGMEHIKNAYTTEKPGQWPFRWF